jgi:hypothetical protein
MKRLTMAVLTLTIGTAGCGSSNPVNPSTIKVFTVQLSSANEVPPITNAEQGGRGTAVITFHTDSNTVDFSVSMANMPNGATAFLAHIHSAPAGVNGGVLIGLPLSAANAIQLPSGSGTFTFTGVAGGRDADAAATNVRNILANPQNFYFNIHTPLNPGGVMRGQLQ